MQTTLHSQELVILGVLLIFEVLILLFVLLCRHEKIWQLLLGSVLMLPLIWIAGALIFYQKDTSSHQTPTVIKRTPASV